MARGSKYANNIGRKCYEQKLEKVKIATWPLKLMEQGYKENSNIWIVQGIWLDREQSQISFFKLINSN